MAISNNAPSKKSARSSGLGAAAAWGRVTTDGVGNAIALCYGCTITSIVSGFVITLNNAMSGTDYTVLSNAHGLTPLAVLWTINTISSATVANVFLFDSTATTVNPNGIDVELSFAIYGR